MTVTAELLMGNDPSSIGESEGKSKVFESSGVRVTKPMHGRMGNSARPFAAVEIGFMASVADVRLIEATPRTRQTCIPLDTAHLTLMRRLRTFRKLNDTAIVEVPFSHALFAFAGTTADQHDQQGQSNLGPTVHKGYSASGQA